MAKSHKLLLAALLLGGGYSVALLLGSLNHWIVPQPADRNALVAPGGELVPMTPADVAAAQLDLVPVPVATHEAAPLPALSNVAAPVPAPTPVASLNPPTWLAAASDAPPRELPPVEPDSPRPIAKVTEVTPWGPTAKAEGGSPWDRWPQWDPSIGTDQRNVNPAAEVSTKPRPATMQASFHPAASADARLNDGLESSDERTHIVIDGDSLAKLADRYLDDPQAAHQIYEANRGVLNDPELLPIGVELRIPERKLAGLPPPPGEMPRTVEVPELRAPNQFEPVDSWLDSGADVPRAQLLQPVPLGQID